MSKRVVAIGKNGSRVGEDHPLAALTDMEVERIRGLHEGHDLSYAQLAAMFEVTKSQIAGICQYRRRASTPFGYKTLNVEDEDVKQA